MRLIQLSPSELREITKLLIADEIARLAMCGCSTLRNKLLNNGGVVELRFEFQPVPRKHVWPSFIQSLQHLNRLAIYDLAASITPQVTAEQLLHLPREVNELVLHMTGATEAFCSALTQDPSRYDSLTQLRLVNMPLIMDDRIEQVQWPKNLITLQLGDVTGARLDVSTLPPGLTSINGWFKSLKPVPEDCIFPVTLTEAILEFSQELSIEVVSKLSNASSLKTLSLNLPRSRTKSPFALARPPLKAPASEVLPLLPRSLEFLEILLEVPANVQAFQLLPPNLRFVRGILPPLMMHPHFPKLPASLTRFRSRVPVTEVDALSSRWPSIIDHERTGSNGLPIVHGGLQKLRLGPSILGSLGAKITFPINLPPSLTSLTIDCTTADENGVRYSIKGPLVLPMGLVALKIRNGYNTNLEVMKQGLPPYLKIFTNDEGFGNAECLKYLPRSVTIMNTGNWSESPNAHYPTESSLWMPPALTKLTLGPISISSFSWINGLPQTLTSLNLNLSGPSKGQISFKQTENEAVRFPPRLVLLHFSFAPNVLDIASLIPLLPPLLVTFWLGHKTLPGLSNSDVEHLPRNIQSLRFSRSDIITEASIPFLPPYVRSLSLGFQTPPWFVPRRIDDAG